MDIPNAGHPGMTLQKVALISFHTCPLAPLGSGKAGGMNVYVRNLVHHLGRLGVHTDVLTRVHVGSEPPSALGAETRLIHLKGGPPEAPVSDLPDYLPDFSEALRCWGEEEGRGYSLVHAHYWMSAQAGIHLAREWNVPLVVTFHTLARAKQQALQDGDDPPLRFTLECEAASEADLIIVSTPHEKSVLVEFYDVSPERVEVVPPGVDLSLFRPVERRQARQRVGLRDDEKVLLYVGRLDPIKGIDLLLRTLALMQDNYPLKAVIVGGEGRGHPDTEELEKLAQNLGVEGQLSMVGRVPQEELSLFYSAADVCVVPSYYESFGLTALEAMACGTPVVASRVGGLPYVIQDGRTGYLAEKRSPEAFAPLLERLFADEDLRSQMGREAQRRVISFGWRYTAERIATLYNQLCVPGRKGLATVCDG